VLVPLFPWFGVKLVLLSLPCPEFVGEPLIHPAMTVLPIAALASRNFRRVDSVRRIALILGWPKVVFEIRQLVGGPSKWG